MNLRTPRDSRSTIPNETSPAIVLAGPYGQATAISRHIPDAGALKSLSLFSPWDHPACTSTAYQPQQLIDTV